MSGEPQSFVSKAPCDKCGSKDNVGVYSDGHTYCFGCHTYTPPPQPDGDFSEVIDFSPKENKIEKVVFEKGEAQSIPSRNLTEATCKHWRYQIGTHSDEPCQIANYIVDGKIVAQKIRKKNKKIFTRGNIRKAGLYGQHLWSKGKMIVVTEGELDALSVSQVQNNKWPVVSVSTGSAGAAGVIKRNLDYLLKFQTIVLMFDNDEAGEAAVAECAPLLPAGRCKVARLPLNDASEMLQAGRGKEIIDAMWQAKEYRPDGIVSGPELWDEFIRNDDTQSVPYPWEGLNSKTRGLRKRELTVFTAGSGIGKSAIVKEIAHHLLTQGETVGLICLEESIRHTLRTLVGIEINERLNLNFDDIPEDTLRDGFDRVVASNRLFLYDHWGSLGSDNLLERVRYFAAMGCSFCVLDHLSIVVSDNMENDMGSERLLIDSIMTRLRSLVEETGMGLILVSHLKRPEGKSHEEGGQTSLAQLRGSGAIGHLSDIVCGCERNQQDSDNAHRTTIRVLKNRFCGETGIATTLEFNRDTGRLLEVDSDAEDF